MRYIKPFPVIRFPAFIQFIEIFLEFQNSITFLNYEVKFLNQR